MSRAVSSSNREDLEESQCGEALLGIAIGEPAEPTTL